LQEAVEEKKKNGEVEAVAANETHHEENKPTENGKQTCLVTSYNANFLFQERPMD
jgi:hypothetical protein